ncbi:hypothetical protein [Silvibacterium acidisoli]|uniref:hypothetical protein n=1 Tax=Acidobacteriaceae bacterium ZG23-2 TaxID=2883246 RepID=UPI00406D0AC0
MSVKTADDTIRDEMDLGYVATRPRFTRARRTWTINTRNLNLEDVRVLDIFAQQTVKRGSLPFYYPNLAPNWSFELPASKPFEIAQGWTVREAQLCTVGLASSASDGSVAMSFASVAGSLPSGASLIGSVQAQQSFPVKPGETYVGSFQWKANVTGQASLGIYVFAYIVISLEFTDGSTALVNPAYLPGITGTQATYVAEQFSFVIPSPPANLSISRARVVLMVTGQNVTNATLPVSAPGSGNSLAVWLDCIGLALSQVASGQSIYGRMAGAQSLGVPVRFGANQIPQFSDLGPSGGQKLYGTTFQLEEV